MGTPKGDVRRGRGPTASRRSATSSVELRAAQPRDSAAVAELLGELGYPSTQEQAAERIEHIAADPSTWLVVAELEGEIAGFGVLHVQNLVERDEPGVEVAGLVVGKRFRRQGVGELLMKALEDEARARGGTTMVLNTAHSRADAHAFYEALGYEHTGRRYAKPLTQGQSPDGDSPC
jgi:ribosomal protein S18 acetylase RimI-like enzyme